jgi:hypothetical protein
MHRRLRPDLSGSPTDNAAEMRNGAHTADATRSVPGYLRMLKVIAALLAVWLVVFFGFLSAYSDWGELSPGTLMWSAALAAIGAGGGAALIGGHPIVGFAVLVPLALFFVYVDGATPI